MTSLRSPAAAAAAAAAAALTVADQLAMLAPGTGLRELCRWPPDAFAFTAAVLAGSGAYRCVVSPPTGCAWPPAGEEDPAWAVATFERDAAAWAAGALEPAASLPEPVRLLCDRIALDVPLVELDRPERWTALASLLRLHALADQACAGAGITTDTALRSHAAALLAETGSLSSVPTDRLRVLPKLRPPASGMTLRSLSHHVAMDRSEVEVRWLVAPKRELPPAAGGERLTILLVPHPSVIRARDFVPVPGPLRNMDQSRYGFYEYAPQEPFDLADAIKLVERARQAVGRVDVVVLPEGALDQSEVPDVQAALVGTGVPYLIAGVRQAFAGGALGGNYAHFGADDWQAPPQHKHHRWCLDPAQVHQYHLGAALDPGRSWWEAIQMPRRCLTFVTILERLTVCPLVCEDLARPDPVADVIRSIAPTLVVGLLLDGPQLAARWPARYASVLADDPGCSVLTLTALGMTRRSQPPGYPPSRAIALWKDPRRGLQEILLAEDAQAVALTAHVRSAQARSADGRAGAPVAELVLSGIEQIG